MIIRPTPGGVQDAPSHVGSHRVCAACVSSLGRRLTSTRRNRRSMEAAPSRGVAISAATGAGKQSSRQSFRNLQEGLEPSCPFPVRRHGAVRIPR